MANIKDLGKATAPTGNFNLFKLGDWGSLIAFFFMTFVAMATAQKFTRQAKPIIEKIGGDASLESLTTDTPKKKASGMIVY